MMPQTEIPHGQQGRDDPLLVTHTQWNCITNSVKSSLANETLKAKYLKNHVEWFHLYKREESDL